MKKVLIVAIGLVAGWFGASAFPQSGAPIKTPQINTEYYVGSVQGWYPSIQAAVTSTCTTPGARVVIPAAAAPTDTIGAVTGGCTKVSIVDRGQVPEKNYGWNGSAYVLVPYNSTAPASQEALASDSSGNIIGATKVALRDQVNVFTNTNTVGPSTPASSGSNMSSNLWCLEASYFNAAPSPDDYCFQNSIGTGATPSSALTLTHTGSSGDARLSLGSLTLAAGNFFASQSISGLTVLGLTDVTGVNTVTAGSIGGPSTNQNGGKLISEGSAGQGSFATADIYYFQNILGSGANPTTQFRLVHTGATTQPVLNLQQTDHNFLTAVDILTATGPVTTPGPLGGGTYTTATVCASVASPAVCGTAAAGDIAYAGGSTQQINTTAVTAASQIFIQQDSSAATRLGITCNTAQPGTNFQVVGRSVGSSFTILQSAAASSDLYCLHYFILN